MLCTGETTTNRLVLRWKLSPQTKQLLPDDESGATHLTPADVVEHLHGDAVGTLGEANVVILVLVLGAVLCLGAEGRLVVVHGAGDYSLHQQVD